MSLDLRAEGFCFGDGIAGDVKAGLAGARSGTAGLATATEDVAAADDAAAGRGGGSCPIRNSFDPSTPVLMANGTSRPIKDIKVGDKVTATDPLTGTTVNEPVTLLHRNLDTDLTDLTISAVPVATLAAILTPLTSTVRGSTAVLHTTGHHPFWDATSRQWVAAGALIPGHQLTGPDGQRQYVAAVHN